MATFRIEVAWCGIRAGAYGEKGMRRQMEDETVICASLCDLSSAQLGLKTGMSRQTFSSRAQGASALRGAELRAVWDIRWPRRQAGRHLVTLHPDPSISVGSFKSDSCHPSIPPNKFPPNADSWQVAEFVRTYLAPEPCSKLLPCRRIVCCTRLVRYLCPEVGQRVCQ